MSSNDNHDKLGHLLHYFGLLTEKDVRRGLVVSQHTGLPLGKSLVLLDVVLPEVLRAAIEAQSLIKEGALDRDKAREAMKIVAARQWPLVDALEKIGVTAVTSKGTRLGELLFDAEHLDEEQLEMALMASDNSGLPLGRVLLLLNNLTSPCLKLALELQADIRSGKIERQEAIKHLEQGLAETDGRLDSLTEGDFVRIGELLVAASVLTEAEVSSALHLSSANDKMIGEVLIDMNWLSEDLLVAALRLQEMVWSGGMSVQRAARIIARLTRGEEDARQSLKEEGLEPSELQKNLSFYEFLRLSGYFNRDSMKAIVTDIMKNKNLVKLALTSTRTESDVPDRRLRQAIKQSFQDPDLLSEMIKVVRPRDYQLIESALVMHDLVVSRKLTLEQAVINFTIKRDGLDLI